MSKSYLFVILLLFCVVGSLFSQQITSASPEVMQTLMTVSKRIRLDTCVLQVQYRMLSVTDANKPDKKKDNLMLLQIGLNISKFSDFFVLRGDSLREVHAAQKINLVESTNKLLPLLKGTTPLNVFKNYPAGKITVLDRVPLSTTYKYIEDREKPEWKMEPGNLTVCGYECRKATTSFRGRHYTAWYAPEIAVSEGPWKFWGLPGLILKVEDDRGHYTFEGVAIEKARGIVPIYILDQTYINTTKARFNKALKNFYDNPGGTIQASGVVQGGLPDNIQSRPYNPIELTDE